MSFGHKPSFALCYDFLVLFTELWLKNYIESCGQTWGTSNVDLWVQSVPASRSEVPGVEKTKIITPIDSTGVVTSRFFVKSMRLEKSVSKMG